MSRRPILLFLWPLRVSPDCGFIQSCEAAHPIPAEKGQPEQQQSAESLSLARAPRIRSWLVAGALENEKRKGEWGRKRKAESEVQR